MGELRNLEVLDLSGRGGTVSLAGAPDACPHCHRHIVAKSLVAVVAGEGMRRELDYAYQCTNANCRKMFIAVFEIYLPTGAQFDSYSFRHAIPVSYAPPTIGESVAVLSPSFVDVYGQAMASEVHGLNQLTGCGLRKALEFLVKDFAISRFPKDRDSILSTMLSPCISKFISDPSAQACAKRAAWLGNDETHYLRKWEALDISNLKELIKLTMNWIENVLLTDKYREEMPEN